MYLKVRRFLKLSEYVLLVTLLYLAAKETEGDSNFFHPETEFFATALSHFSHACVSLDPISLGIMIWAAACFFFVSFLFCVDSFYLYL